MFAPHKLEPDCHKSTLASLPFDLIGAVGGYVGGKIVLCGGSRSGYVQCRKEANYDGYHCKKNTDCVITAGGTQWCTRPKTADCYYYSTSYPEEWKFAISLKTPRSYASSVILDDGRMWILGGAGQTDILKSTEFLELTPAGDWKVYPGPDLLQPTMGHCSVLTEDNKVFTIGGFSGETNDYLNTLDIFSFDVIDFISNGWDRKTWRYLKSGYLMDPACGYITGGNGLRGIFDYRFLNHNKHITDVLKLLF